MTAHFSKFLQEMLYTMSTSRKGTFLLSTKQVKRTLKIKPFLGSDTRTISHYVKSMTLFFTETLMVRRKVYSDSRSFDVCMITIKG